MNKILTFYSESHKEIYNNFFTPSYEKYLTKKFNLISEFIPQVCKTGDFASEGFDLAMLKKVEIILSNINTKEDGKFVFSDCDVQFFGDIDIDCNDYDIFFQKDYFDDARCAGFFICKQNKKVKTFFELVYKNLKDSLNGKIDDQYIINKLINNQSDIKHSFLPTEKYWTIGNYTKGKVWDCSEFEVPNSIVMHHANFTIGTKNKIELMSKVKDKIYKSKK